MIHRVVAIELLRYCSPVIFEEIIDEREKVLVEGIDKLHDSVKEVSKENKKTSSFVNNLYERKFK